MNLKTLRTELLQERVHDELRRKWLIDLVDHIIENLPALIYWGNLRRFVMSWKTDLRVNLDCFKTIEMSLPIKPDGEKVIEDDNNTVVILFQPHWGGGETPQDAGLTCEDYGDRIVYIITLPVNSSWIGMEESYEKQKEKTKRSSLGSIWMEGFFNFFLNPKKMKMTKEIGKKVRELLLHEVTHLMDKVEYAESKTKNIEKMKHGYPTLSKYKEYFNHNLEYNAYYLATLTQTLENFDKRKISKGIIETYSQKQFIEACLNQFQIINSSYVNHMSNATKRKIIQRLGRWYNDVLLPEYKAKGKTSFSTKPAPIKKQRTKKSPKPTVEENVLKELESVWP